MSASFRIDSSEVQNNLKALPSKVNAAVGMYAKTASKTLENQAKQNAPWTDRTGHARQRLTGDANEVEKGWQIELSHGVDYGIYLELAHEKRFAILQPTIISRSNEILHGFTHLMDKMGYVSNE